MSLPDAAADHGANARTAPPTAGRTEGAPPPSMSHASRVAPVSHASHASHASHVRALLAGIRDADPLRATFDVAVRRFVRAERNEGRDIEEILADLRRVLRDHVEPQMPVAHRAALRQGVLWFAVSEFHRAD